MIIAIILGEGTVSPLGVGHMAWSGDSSVTLWYKRAMGILWQRSGKMLKIILMGRKVWAQMASGDRVGWGSPAPCLRLQQLQPTRLSEGLSRACAAGVSA